MDAPGAGLAAPVAGLASPACGLPRPRFVGPGQPLGLVEGRGRGPVLAVLRLRGNF